MNTKERINMIKEKLPGKYTFIVNLKSDYLQFDSVPQKFKQTNDVLLMKYNNFDKEMNKVHDLSDAKWSYESCLFNCACPTEYTKEHGIEYAKTRSYIHGLQNALKLYKTNGLTN